jgi:2-methylcitrate dehydratase PrpD
MKRTRREFMYAAGMAGPAAPTVFAQATSGGQAAVFPQVIGLTKEVAEFMVGMTYNDIPSEVIELGKKSILDSIGLALCGSVTKQAELGRKYLNSLGFRGGGATVIGTPLRMPLRFAAFLNGMGIHGDDYDDTQLSIGSDKQYGLLTHPSATALPAALGYGELHSASGRDVMLAYHVGVEVECKIAEAMSNRHYGDGFHTTGTVGTFGAAAAAAKAQKLNLQQCVYALGIAGSSTGGVRENFGTMTKPYHAGKAAELGVVAAELAGLGWTATEQVLEAQRGFFRAAAGNYDPAAITHKLGRPWTFQDPGVSIKPYPSGSLAHPGMTELVRLMKEHELKAQDVERLDVGTNRNVPNTLIYDAPKTGLQGKFSIPFCMATLLLYGKAGLTEFTDEVVNRPEVQSMMKRVHLGVHPEAEKAGYNRLTTILEITLKNGRKVSGRADWAKGSPQIPMSYDEVAKKFRDCADFAKWPAEKSQRIVETVRKLETVSNVMALTLQCKA